MSRDIGIYIQKENFPPTDVLRDAIIQEGFPCVLDDEFDPLNYGGFLLCPVDGSPSGFEYYVRPIDEDELEEVEDSFTPDTVILLSTGRNEREWISAVATASCLAKLAGGIVVDYYTCEQITAEHATDWARTQIALQK
jgi:hypothetical protein